MIVVQIEKFHHCSIGIGIRSRFAAATVAITNDQWRIKNYSFLPKCIHLMANPTCSVPSAVDWIPIDAVHKMCIDTLKSILYRCQRTDATIDEIYIDSTLSRFLVGFRWTYQSGEVFTRRTQYNTMNWIFVEIECSVWFELLRVSIDEQYAIWIHGWSYLFQDARESNFQLLQKTEQKRYIYTQWFIWCSSI